MIQKLLNYQEKDAKLHNIEIQLASNEERKTMAKAKKFLEGVEESVNKLEARATELVAELNNLMAQQKSLKEQYEEFVSCAENAQDETEVSYLIKKLEETSLKIKSATNVVNKISEEMANVTAEYKTVKAKTKNAQLMYKESKEKYKEFKSSFDGESEQIKSELETIKKDIDPVLMQRYIEKREKKIFPILFEVTGEFCVACGMQLSMSELTKLKKGEIIDCDCGKMLYQK